MICLWEKGGGGGGGGRLVEAKCQANSSIYDMRITIFLQQRIRLNDVSYSKWILERKSSYNFFAKTKSLQIK